MIGHDILAELSVANVRAHVEKIVRDIPTRLAGSENGRRMAEYSAAALRSAQACPPTCTNCRRS